MFTSSGRDRGRTFRLASWVKPAGDALLAALVVVGWTALNGEFRPGARLMAPLALVVTGCAARAWEGRRWQGSFLIILAATLAGCATPAWPGAPTALLRGYVVLAAFGAAGAVGLLARLADGPAPTAPERLRVLLLALLFCLSWWAYFTPNIVGVVDERWYGDLMADFLWQVRSGHFPVFAGQSEYAWNGNIHPFRSAPVHHCLGAILDLLTLRSLSPLAVQHASALASLAAASALAYVGCRRLRPDRPWLALLVAVSLAICPAITQPQIRHDMYMTTAALPFVVLVGLCLVRVLESPRPKAWLWLGVGVAGTWQAHPPVALLVTAVVAATLLLRLWAAPVERREWLGLALFGGATLSCGLGYALSMRELSGLPVPLEKDDALANVIVPGAAFVALVAGIAVLRRKHGAVSTGLAAGAVAVALEAFAWLQPALFGPAMAFTGLLAVAAILHPARGSSFLSKRPELIPLLCAIAVATFFSGGLAREPLADPLLEGAREHLDQLLKPLWLGGLDQPGFATLAAVVVAVALAIRPPVRGIRPFVLAVALLFLALVPVPGAWRFAWRAVPDEVTRIIGVSYSLRILPALAPLLWLAVYVVLADAAPAKLSRRLAFALALLLPWSAWEHIHSVRLSWRFRHDAATTAKHLRSEHRTLSRFHYDLLPISPYLSNGVADFRIETRLWQKGPPGEIEIGPDQYAEAMAKAQDARWQPVSVRQDPLYPAWIYLSPGVRLAPGARFLVQFDWREPNTQGWLIARGSSLYRDYLLPQSGFNRSFGTTIEHHHTLSLWNTGTDTEEVELVLKREGPDAERPFPAGLSPARVRIVRYQADVAPVEVLSLLPLQLLTRTQYPAVVETFRVWQPGYRVSLDGRPVPNRRTRQGLLSYSVPAGTHIAEIRLRGTPALRFAAGWTGAVAVAVLLAAAAEIVRLARRPNSLLPSGAERLS